MKRIKIITLFSLLWFSLYSQQSFEWGVRAGSAGSDEVNDIASIGEDIYVTGKYSGAFKSGSEEVKGSGMTDIYLLKLNRKGSTGWVRSLSGEGAGTGNRLAVREENIYLGGTISGSVMEDKNEFPGEGPSLFVSSWSKQGKINWLTRVPFRGNATLDVLETAPDGSLLVGGMISGFLVSGKDTLSSRPGRRAYTLLVSPDGELKEAVLSGGKGDNRLVAAQYGTGDVRYLLFNTQGRMHYGKNAALFSQDETFKGLVLVKETDGEASWVKYIWGSGYIQGVRLTVSEDNTVTTCINYNKNIMLPDTVLSTSALEDVAIVNYSAEGQQKWLKQLKSPVVCYAMDALQTRTGKLLLTGYFRDDYSLGTANVLADNNHVEESMFLVQLDKNGELSWHDEPGEQASAFGKSLTIGSQGDIYMAGGFKNEMSLNGEKLKSAGKDDVLIARYFNCEQLAVNIRASGPFCPGSWTELTVSGKSYESFLWNDSVWAETFPVFTPGNYFVEAFDRKGCSTKDTITVSWPEVPGLGLPERILVTPENETLLTANEGFAGYLWNDGTSGANLVVRYRSKADSSVLILTAETFEGCLVSDTTIARFPKSGGGGMIHNVSSLSVYPNPVHDELSWYCQTSGRADVTVKLFDGKGVLVYQDEIGNYIPGSVQNIDMRRMVSGNYMLTLLIGENSYNEKIVKK
ncbi:MAG: T9SS type A sorting domain-containing protein [Draconibacterium sp.]